MDVPFLSELRECIFAAVVHLLECWAVHFLSVIDLECQGDCVLVARVVQRLLVSSAARFEFCVSPGSDFVFVPAVLIGLIFPVRHELGGRASGNLH